MTKQKTNRRTDGTSLYRAGAVRYIRTEGDGYDAYATYEVIGSQGDKYEVVMQVRGTAATCTCRDHAKLRAKKEWYEAKYPKKQWYGEKNCKHIWAATTFQIEEAKAERARKEEEHQRRVEESHREQARQAAMRQKEQEYAEFLLRRREEAARYDLMMTEQAERDRERAAELQLSIF